MCANQCDLVSRFLQLPLVVVVCVCVHVCMHTRSHACKCVFICMLAHVSACMRSQTLEVAVGSLVLLLSTLPFEEAICH